MITINRKINSMANFCHFHLKSLALAFGLLGGHSDYHRFIILGMGRSGSNFLRGLLNSHSQIVAFGELFRFYDSIGWEFSDYDEYLQYRGLKSLMQRDPIRFLEKKVFGKFSKLTSAVGFKIFYYHAIDYSREIVWTYLRDQEDLKIIHLKRNNTLEVVLSEEKANMTNRWTNITGEEEEKFSVPLDYEECLQAFIRAEAEKRQHDIFFKDNDKIDVYYEDLTRDYGTEMKRIQEFLGVNYEVVRPSTYKQSNLSISEAISNYLELKEKFKDTPWEKFFED